MPAKKPHSLHNWHAGRDAAAARAAGEELMQSKRPLPEEPAALASHPAALAVWRRLIREYGAVEGVIVTRLDMDLLLDYCLLLEQLEEIDQLRKVAFDTWAAAAKKYENQKKDQNNSDGQARLAIKVVDAVEAMAKLDGRADKKRDLILKIRQSLYLTPRARAGVAPQGRAKEPPPDPFEELLNRLPGKGA